MIDLKKTYSPAEIETKWYDIWEEKGYFKPSDDALKPSFCIVIPPPNVTGSLHMGHALNATIQDILIRWKRMSGHRALWIPGTDHAGIATQNVVERELSKEGITRQSLGRDAFIERVWKWKSEYGGRIIHQLKRLGSSCDWSRERFTLDEGLSRAVREVFVWLFEEGLIYRENRLINWCPRCHTALSDIEVEHEEIDGRLYYIRYPLAPSAAAGEGYITVATTRPETMLGDTAVAVNPDDKRYKNLAGNVINLPLTGRKIPIVLDESVDSAFGTGAVKVTPAHDFNDEAIGKRHGVPSITVIAEDGRMSPEAGERYAGLDRHQCRKKVIEDLRELDLLDGEKRHSHAVGHCYRCKTIIEPLLTVQWYVKIEPLAKEAVKAVESGRIRLIPDSWDNNYFAWMRDIKDWCISRQIWWGHRIPVWYCTDCELNELRQSSAAKQGDVIEHLFYEPVEIQGRSISGGAYSELRNLGISHEDIIAKSKAITVPRHVKPLCSRQDLTECPDCGSRNLIRDPDVLDTWFSSSLWPFSTLGWPDSAQDSADDLKSFYPSSVLVTGFDIIFFWVARMIMMGLKFMGDAPFNDVYIHALVRDQKGQKMSKSKGNVIDPLVMIEKYGADAFRFSLAAFAAQGRDVRFSEQRVEGYRHFINKLWNAARFIVNYSEFWYELRGKQSSPNSHSGQYASQFNALDIPGKWILTRLGSSIRDVDRHLANYRFNDAASSIYQFVWHEFCDWYIELTKPVLYGEDNEAKSRVVNCLFFVLEKVIRLLHPFAPFVTEEMWNNIFTGKGSIMVSEYPKPEDVPGFNIEEKQMAIIIDAVSAIRSIRGELNISPSLEMSAFIKTLSDDAEDVLRKNIAAIERLTKCKKITAGMDIKRLKGSAVAVREHMEVYIPIEGLLDIKTEIGRLQKEKEKIEESVIFLSKKLSNEDFIRNARGDVVEKEQARFEDLLQKKEKVEDNIKLLVAIN
ncbi:MAG: valine--tRNA ligase [Nitrospirae bacterium]|nr:valine--tRNA ligase [Nitrospirota bacterium]